MANPFPFVAGEILTAADMNGIGESSTYTPTYTNFSLGNGSVVARFVRVQNLICVSTRIACGSTSAFTGTGMTISKPITGSTNNTGVLGTVLFVDSSTGQIFFGPVQNTSTTSVNLNLFLTSTTYAEVAFTTASIPMTLAANDVISLNYVYEAA
jgi:hypothetical protein